MNKLLSPIKLGALELKNRVIMAPLTRKRATREMIPTEIMATYYAQRASAGLIISEATNISENAMGYTNTPGIFNEEQIKAWQAVTNAVHEKNGAIFCQLWHVGRHSHPELLKGKLPVAPSAVKEDGYITTYLGKKETVVPKELSKEEIKQIITQYGDAAHNAIEAGFDGVEIHGANGYLIDQFIQDGTNKRQDEYGGGITNRIRFALEVTDEVCKRIGDDKTAIRLSPSGIKLDMSDSNPAKTFSELIGELNEFNLAYLHLLEPWFDVSNRPDYVQNVAQYFRGVYQGNLMANNSFDFHSASKLLSDGFADMVSFGKLFISNPDLVERFRESTPLNNWDERYFYSGEEKGYTDYPTLMG